MKYQLLAKLYYKDRTAYTQLYESRLHNEDSTYILPLEIAKSPVFIVVSKEVNRLMEQIYYRNNKLTRLYKSLPSVAVQAYLQKSMVEEILLSNDIEGVYSTKKELRIVLKEKARHKRIRRFQGLANKYNMILDDLEIPLNTSREIRSLYNEILLPEIDKDDLPDGKLFRKGSVSVYDIRDKEIHQGILPEKRLIDFMDTSLAWLHKEVDIPQIIRIAAFHYLFGYMHPFYDGNGRMDRFVSSYLLKDTLNFLVSVRISHVISNQKTEYYRAFQVCNDGKNKGDITPFIIMFLSIIRDAIESLVSDLSDSCSKLDHYDEVIKLHLKALPDIEKQLLFIIIQNTLFSDEAIDITGLREAVKKSDTWIRKYLGELENDNLVLRERNGHSVVYSANFEALDNLM